MNEFWREARLKLFSYAVAALFNLVCIHMRNGGVLGRRPWRRAPRAMAAQLGMNLSQWSDDASWAADVAGRSQRTRDNYYRARWPYGGVDTAKIGSTSQT